MRERELRMVNVLKTLLCAIQLIAAGAFFAWILACLIVGTLVMASEIGCG